MASGINHPTCGTRIPGGQSAEIRTDVIRFKLLVCNQARHVAISSATADGMRTWSETAGSLRFVGRDAHALLLR